jgi:hypothetical protein
VHDWGRDGIHVGFNSTDVVVRGNLVEDCNDDHIVADGKRIVVDGNCCFAQDTNWGAAIAVQSGRDVTITGNLLYGGVRGGIEVRAPASDVEISGNSIIEAGHILDPVSPGVATDPPAPGWGQSRGSGINLLANNSGNAIDRVTISDNVITAPRYHGIQLYGAASSGIDRNGTINDVAISRNVIRLDQGADYLDPSFPGSPIATSDAGGTENVRVCANHIRGALGPGIRVAGDNRRWEIQGNCILDSGTTPPTEPTDPPEQRQPAISLDGVEDVTVSGNRAHDTRSTKEQEYGLALTDPSGANVITGNTFAGNAQVGGHDTVINISGETAGGRLRIRDNVGFNPWVGSAPDNGSLMGHTEVSGIHFWGKSVVIPFGVSFPSASVPRVYVAASREGYAASVVDVSPSDFTARVWVGTASASQPLASDSVTIYWVAEPAD